MAREKETPTDLSGEAMRAGEKVTKEATTQAENAGKAAMSAFEESSRAASGVFEASGRAASGAMTASMKAVQNYQAKLVQCFQANAEANLQLAQKLTQTRSPADFVETMSSHMRERVALMTEQGKELAALGQEATRSAVDAIARPSQ